MNRANEEDDDGATVVAAGDGNEDMVAFIEDDEDDDEEDEEGDAFSLIICSMLSLLKVSIYNTVNPQRLDHSPN